jgi:mannose-6-phosphate isomerase-like protein (cupin superfamily)
MRLVALLPWSAPVLLAATAGCTRGEKTATNQSPPLTIASPPSPPPPPPPSPASASPAAAAWPADAPARARFVTLSAEQGPKRFPLATCTEAFVSPVQGSATADGEKLAEGDVLALRGAASFPLNGDGVVLVADVRLGPGCEGADAGSPSKRVVRAAEAPELAFMKGTMRAHLDVDDRALAPTAYFGRLAGTAPVAEHAHAGSWEILCAVRAAGTFTLAGKAERLAPLTCVAVPPDTKHSWQPDTGSDLVAVQMYSPPGPEQRFKKLAADEGSAARDH